MKRFRNKKNKEEAVTAPSTPISMTAPPLPVFPAAQVHVSAQPPPPPQEPKGGRWFGMGGKKAAEEEAKPEIDLTSALPSTDEFRTSLLMTGLSARFSMLREQDDPTTKVGKASDDSVLFPKRGGSTNDYGLAFLGDISEVDSLRPFARKNSYGSDDASSMTGSIMNRSRPTDGNNLFGGRQKVYKLVEGKGGMSGRALYDDDVALSAFQKLRREEKQRRREETGRSEDDDDDDEEEEEYEEGEDAAAPAAPAAAAPARAPSPTGFSRRRETSSTTSSTPSLARLSTAATSVHSTSLAPAPQSSSSSSARDSTGPSPAERSVARTRRLYEQGLSQELHDNHSSVLSRIDTLSRRGFGAPAPAPVAGGGLAERLGDRRGLLAKSSAPNLRTTLTPPAMATPRPSPTEKSFPALIREGSTLTTTTTTSGGTMPLTPPMSAGIDELTFQPIVPEERKPQGLGILRPHHKLGLGLDTRNAPPVLEIRTAGPDARTMSFLDGPDSPEENVPKSAIDVHPMFRDALPIPTVVAMPPPPKEQVVEAGPSTSAHDSPTLGLTTGGLSGMVRQHLRADSNASSIYGPEGHAADEDEDDAPAHSSNAKQASPLPSSTGANDEFASQLADGARRVRERMTSYVEADSPTTGPFKPSDTTRDHQAAAAAAAAVAAASPPAPTAPPPPPPRASNFGLLKSKTSLGSLASGGGQRDKSMMQKLGLAAVTMASSPTVERSNPMEDATVRESAAEETGGETTTATTTTTTPTPADDDNSGVHAGLRAFRQAKREMQRLKEIETQQRHADRSPPGIPPQSRDRKHPPVSFQRQSGDEPPSRSSSRAPSARERSGSETSGGGSRPPRLRQPLALSAAADGRAPMARSPGLPGTDIRGSPHMPPAQYPGRLGGAAPPLSATAAQPPYRAWDPHGPPPGSPLTLTSPPPLSQNSVPSSPVGGRLDESMRRSVRKRDISGPTFMRTTSQVPTVSLEEGQSRSGSRSRSGSLASSSGAVDAAAPPLPPINPKRRVLGNIVTTAGASSTSLALKSPASPTKGGMF